MMRTKRILSVCLAGVALITTVAADFDGPAPLAWRWVQPTSNSPTGTPTVSDNTVYVAVGTRMFALDKETGNQRWKFPLVDPIEGYFKSSVIITDGVAVAAASNKSIYGVDAKTGETRWTYVAQAPIYKEPVLAGKYIVFGMSDNTIMAIGASDGQPVWKNPIKVFEGFLGKFASYQNDVFYFTNSYNMVSVSANSQKVNWTQRFSVLGPDTQATVLGDTVYVNTGSFVVGISATGNGRKVFEGNSNDQLDFGPAANGDTVCGVSQEGKVYIFGSNGRPVNFTYVENGKTMRKEINLGSQPATSPSVVGKYYAIPTRNGAINLVDPKTGDIKWSYLVRPIGDQSAQPTTGGGLPGGGRPGGGGGGATQTVAKVLAIPAAGPAIVSGDTLMLMTVDGSLLAFDKNLGVDLTPPAVKMQWPSPGDLVSGQPPLELIFKIEDEASGINTKTLKIDIDGQDMEYEFGRDGIASVRFSSLGKNKPLMDGRKTISVTVSDWMGNQNVARFFLVIDNTLKPLQRPTNNSNTGGGFGPGGGKGGGGGGGFGGG